MREFFFLSACAGLVCVFVCVLCVSMSLKDILPGLSHPTWAVMALLPVSAEKSSQQAPRTASSPLQRVMHTNRQLSPDEAARFTMIKDKFENLTRLEEMQSPVCVCTRGRVSIA